MSSQRLLVTVECESGRTEIALPTDIPIARLLPQLLDLCGDAGIRFPDAPTQWVVRRDGQLLPGDLTLSECEVAEGTLLSLQDLARDAKAAQGQLTSGEMSGTEAAGPVDGRPPGDRSQAAHVVLPRRVDLPHRLRAMGEAVISGESADGPFDSVAAPAAEGTHRLRVTRSRSALDRAREAWRSTDYGSRLAEMIAAPRLLRCVTIAVVSPKGGVGKTTTAALLGTLFSMIRSDRVVAVDTNPDHGTLGRSLASGHPIFIDDLLGVIDQPALTVTMLERFLGRGPHGLLVLPSPVDPERMERLDRAAYRRVIHRLQQLAGMIILDCGAGLRHPATQAALEVADQLVFVADADPLTAGIVVEAANRMRDHRSYTVLVNRMPPGGGRLDMEGLVAEAGDARGVVAVSEDRDAAARVGDGRFSWETAPADWQLAYRRLAAILAADWQQLDLIA